MRQIPPTQRPPSTGMVADDHWSGREKCNPQLTLSRIAPIPRKSSIRVEIAKNVLRAQELREHPAHEDWFVVRKMQFGIQEKELNVAAVRDGEIGHAILERSRRRPRRQCAPYPANIAPRKPLRYNELTKPPDLCDSYPRKASRRRHSGQGRARKRAPVNLLCRVGNQCSLSIRESDECAISPDPRGSGVRKE